MGISPRLQFFYFRGITTSRRVRDCDAVVPKALTPKNSGELIFNVTTLALSLVFFLGDWLGNPLTLYGKPSLAECSCLVTLFPPFAMITKWTPILISDSVHAIFQQHRDTLHFRRKKQPKDKVYGPDIPATSGAHTSGYPCPHVGIFLPNTSLGGPCSGLKRPRIRGREEKPRQKKAKIRKNKKH